MKDVHDALTRVKRAIEVFHHGVVIVDKAGQVIDVQLEDLHVVRDALQAIIDDAAESESVGVLVNGGAVTFRGAHTGPTYQCDRCWESTPYDSGSRDCPACGEPKPAYRDDDEG